MHVTLHLTGWCNFRCRYCYAAPHEESEMTAEIARAAVDLASRECLSRDPEQSVGVIFFGGEPLLCRQRIVETIAYCKELGARTGQSFYFKITTNGALLDESFLTDELTREVFVAMSHDGVRAAHDAQRIDVSGAGTFDRLQAKIALLLHHKPYAPVMLVTTPQTAPHLADSVQYLFEQGFRYLICSLDYSSRWTHKDLAALQRQYDRLGAWYVEQTRAERKFYFSPFDVKIASHVYPGSCRAERCELGKRQISVAPTGRLFPCVQFVGDGSASEWAIGDVWSGIDECRREALYQRNAEEKSSCSTCAIRERCNHFCGCLNRQATGSIDVVSPVLCAHEQMTLTAADRAAEQLFGKRDALFLQKQYNPLFPIVSLAEDQSAPSSN